MSRTRSALIAALALLLALPAGASPQAAPPRDKDPAALPDTALAGTALPDAAATLEALAEAAGAGKAGTTAALLATVAARTAGVDRAQVLATRGAGGDEPTVRGQAADGPDTSVALTVVGDLDGDEGQDVVALRSDDATAETIHVAGREGRTGATLWERSFDGQFGFVLPLDPTAGAEPAVLVVTATQQEQQGSGSVEQTLTALRADGEVVWEDTRQGAASETPLSQSLLGVPVFGGLAATADGQGVLIGLVDLVLGPAGPEPGRTTAILLDTSTGAERGRAERRTTSQFAIPTPGPDATGDGNDDILFLLLSLDEPTVGLALHDAATGAEVWAADDLGPGALFGLTPVGDATGDGVVDLATGDAFGFDGETTGSDLLSGRTGEVVWNRPGGFPVALGDISGDGRADVGLLGAGPLAGRVRWSAFDGDGALLYQRAFAPGITTPAVVTGLGLGGVGDLDGDGVPDVTVTTTDPLGDLRTPTGGLALSGATGETLWRRATGSPTGPGTGQLLLTDVPAPGLLGLRSQAGADGDLRWQRVLRTPGGETADGTEDEVIDVFTQAATRSDGLDLVATVLRGSSELVEEDDGFSFTFTLAACGVVLDGTDGAVRWQAPQGCLLAPSDGAPAIQRLAGADRTATAAAVARSTWPAASTVLLARADDYADALTGTPLARSLGAPLLFTSTGSLPAATRAELERLAPDRVIVLGGPAAVSEAVLDQLGEIGLFAERIAGANRFETAARIAARLGPDVPAAIVAEGINVDPARGWPDALSSAPVAGALARPILLVTRDALPEATGRALRELGVVRTTVVGGQAAVGPEVVAALNLGGHGARRSSGPDRYGTNRAVHALALTAGADPGVAWVGTGRNWPDALTAGAAVAARGETLVLVDGIDLDRSAATRDLLATTDLRHALLLGGEGVVAAATAARVEGFVGP